MAADARTIAEDAIRRRAYQLWQEEGQPEGRHDEHWRQAREELWREFQQATEHAGEDPDRLKYPQAIEEAIQDPGRSRRPGGGEWATTADQRGAP